MVYELYSTSTRTYLTHTRNDGTSQNETTEGQQDQRRPTDQLICIENDESGGIHCSGLLGVSKQIRNEFLTVLARLQTLQLSGHYIGTKSSLKRYNVTSLPNVYLAGLKSVKLNCGLRALNRFGKDALRYHSETFRRYLPKSVRDFTLDVHELRPPDLQEEMDVLTRLYCDNQGTSRDEMKSSLNKPEVFCALLRDIDPVMAYCPRWIVTTMTYDQCRATITISFWVDYAGLRWKIFDLEISRISPTAKDDFSDWKPTLSYSQAFLAWVDEAPDAIYRPPSWPSCRTYRLGRRRRVRRV
jgi:hypothetical protein